MDATAKQRHHRHVVHRHHHEIVTSVENQEFAPATTTNNLMCSGSDISFWNANERRPGDNAISMYKLPVVLARLVIHKSSCISCGNY
jgi:hypothetical protein